MAKSSLTFVSGMRSPSPKISLLRLACFASPWFPVGALVLPLSVFLPPLYAGIAGLGLVLTGQILVATRLLDILSDPFIGAMSDATRLRFGRRKLWILAGLPVYCLGVWFLLNPPAFSGSASQPWSPAGLYFIAASLAAAIGSSLIIVPHAAWSAELSHDYDERSRIMGANEWVNLVGVLAVAVVGTVLEQVDKASIAQQMHAVALTLVVAAPVCVACCLCALPEPSMPARSKAMQPHAWRLLFDALKNKLFLRLSAVKFINSIAESIAQALWVFVAASVLGLGAEATTLLAIHIFMGFVSIPLWTVISYRLEKRIACALALLWRICLTPFILLLPHGQFATTALFMAVVGLSLGAESSLLRAMVADTVDDQLARTGLAPAGAFQGAFNLISNLGKTFGVGLIYPLLAMFGYSQALLKDSAVASAHAGMHDRLPALFYAFVPPLLNLLGVWWLRKFRLTRRDIEALQQRLGER